MIILRIKQFGNIADNYKNDLLNKDFPDAHKLALVKEAIKAEEEGASKEEIKQRLINASEEWRKEDLSSGKPAVAGALAGALAGSHVAWKTVPSFNALGVYTAAGAGVGAGLGYLIGKLANKIRSRKGSSYNRDRDVDRDEDIDEILSYYLND